MPDSLVRAATASTEAAEVIFRFPDRQDNSIVKFANTKVPDRPPTILKSMPVPIFIFKMQ